MNSPTLKKNQNGAEAALVTTGIRNSEPRKMSPRITTSRMYLCAVEGWRFSKKIDAKPEPASTRNGTPALSGQSSHATFGNGRSQPPQNSVTATEATTKMLLYSARKYSAKRKPEYA